MPAVSGPPRQSGTRGPKVPRSAANASGRGGGNHSPAPRPAPPGKGQDTPRDSIPFPNRAPPGRPASASAEAPAAPAVFFFDPEGNPLRWTRDGPAPSPAPQPCAASFGPLAKGDVLVAAQGWAVVAIEKHPSYSRNVRPRWDVFIRPLQP